MPSTYTNILRLELQADGENDGTWGQILNDNVIALIEDAIAATASINTTGGTTTLSTNDGADDQARRKVLDVSGSLGSDAIIEVPAQSKTYVVRNGTSGSFTVEVLVDGQSAGAGIEVPQGETQVLYCDGSNVEAAAPAVPSTGASALFDSDLAANGGLIPETDRSNTFTEQQSISKADANYQFRADATSGGTTGGAGFYVVEPGNFDMIWGLPKGEDYSTIVRSSDLNDKNAEVIKFSNPGNLDVDTPNGNLHEGGTRVVESGSNSDGDWVRYSDGTQIVSIQSGQQGRGSGLTLTWPNTFTTQPGGISAAPRTNSTSTQTNDFTIDDDDTNGTTLTYNSNNSYITVVAVGRWT